MGKDIVKVNANPIEKKKSEVRTYSKVAVVCGGVTAAAFLSWIFLSTSLIWMVLWGAGTLYGTFRVGKAIS